MSTEQNSMVSVQGILESSEMREKVEALLPPGVTYDRFTQTIIIALQHNPDLLSADRQSLYNAISRCAADGLMPDGKDGALVIFNVNRGPKGQPPQWVKVVQWMPMVEGIIKQMGKAGIRCYAATVYEGEEFDIWYDDDGQHVIHRPKPFVTQGAALGVYACAKVEGRTYIEALNKDDIATIRSSSKSGDSGPWLTWPDRMAQKSALHRLKKRVPILDAGIVASLRDPEEDPEMASAPTAAAEPSASPSNEGVAAATAAPAKRRPRGLAALVDGRKEQASADAVMTQAPEPAKQTVSIEDAKKIVADQKKAAPPLANIADDEGDVF
jgi:phage RecT family recombinase